MRCTLKWWRQNDYKPGAVEYRRFASSHEIEAAIRNLLDTVRVQTVQIHNEAGELLAQYPDPKMYRARGL